jgi:hypothetical protein
MPYRVTLKVTAQSIKIDDDGDFIRSPSGILQLQSMGLQDTPPVLVGKNSDGSYTTTRDFDTEELANTWLTYYQTRPAYISGEVSQVDQKIVTAHSDKYWEKNPDDWLNLHMSLPGAD